MSVYWMNTDQIMKFVELYRNCECLWDIQLHSYKCRDARDQALKQVSEEMNITGFGPKEVAQKIKNIRTTYKQEVHKILKSKTTGSSSDNIYKPKRCV